MSETGEEGKRFGWREVLETAKTRNHPLALLAISFILEFLQCLILNNVKLIVSMKRLPELASQIVRFQFRCSPIAINVLVITLHGSQPEMNKECIVSGRSSTSSLVPYECLCYNSLL